MAKAETDIVHAIMLEASSRGVVLWKNVRGKFRAMYSDTVISAGLSAQGSSDLIGYKRVTVTPDMVGQTLAVFCAVEVKTSTGAVRPEQAAFCERVSARGGISGIARSVADFIQIIS